MLASIDFLAMASSNGEASIRVDSTDTEKSAEDSLEELLEKNPQLIIMKFFSDLAKKNPLAKEGKPVVPMTSVAPEALDSLLEVLRGASMDEEHRTVMCAVIQKVRSTKAD